MVEYKNPKNRIKREKKLAELFKLKKVLIKKNLITQEDIDNEDEQ